MRIALFIFGGLNLLSAILILSAGTALRAANSMEFQQNRQRLIEAGALVEHPERAPNQSGSSDAWLWHGLLPQHSQRITNSATVLAVGFAGQAVVLLMLGVWCSWRLGRGARRAATMLLVDGPPQREV